MLFLGYDPGGKGTHGVALLDVAEDGVITTDPICSVVEDAEAAWAWLSAHKDAVAIGIDTLLAWSPRGSRACDNALRRKYHQHGPTVIPQNSLYSSMTINGAIIARRAARSGLPLFESHPKLFIKSQLPTGPALSSIFSAYTAIKVRGENTTKQTVKRADDMADAVVAAWCAAQGFSKRWRIDLFETPEDMLELVVDGATYPWPEQVW